MAKKMSPMDQKAALKALGDYRGEATKLMKDKMNGLKKKAPMEKDGKSSLAEAYEEAEDLLDSDDEETELEEFGEEMAGEDSSEEELDQKIAELMAKKKKMESMR